MLASFVFLDFGMNLARSLDELLLPEGEDGAPHSDKVSSSIHHSASELCLNYTEPGAESIIAHHQGSSDTSSTWPFAKPHQNATNGYGNGHDQHVDDGLHNKHTHTTILITMDAKHYRTICRHLRILDRPCNYLSHAYGLPTLTRS